MTANELFEALGTVRFMGKDGSPSRPLLWAETTAGPLGERAPPIHEMDPK